MENHKCSSFYCRMQCSGEGLLQHIKNGNITNNLNVKKHIAPVHQGIAMSATPQYPEIACTTKNMKKTMAALFFSKPKKNLLHCKNQTSTNSTEIYPPSSFNESIWNNGCFAASLGRMLCHRGYSSWRMLCRRGSSSWQMLCRQFSTLTDALSS